MNLGSKGIELIKKYEGCRLEAYKCPSDVWTIGWGHTAGVYEGQIITQEEADRMFLEDVKVYSNAVDKYNSKFNFTQNQFDALTSFCYNCGQGALDDVMSSGNVTGTMALYVNGGGVKLPGLVRRRNEEIELYNTPVTATSNNAGEYIIKEYKEEGTFTCTAYAIYFRNKPYVGSDNPTQGHYLKGEKVIYDYVVITNKYVYISWISASTGIRRYMPITDKVTNEKWGYCV